MPLRLLAAGRWIAQQRAGADRRSGDAGQPIDYSDRAGKEISTITIDTLALEQIDLIKIDVEGMELEALEGGKESLVRSRPILIVESVKSDKARLRSVLEQLGYRLFEMGMNFLTIRESDGTLDHVKTVMTAAA